MNSASAYCKTESMLPLEICQCSELAVKAGKCSTKNSKWCEPTVKSFMNSAGPHHCWTNRGEFEDVSESSSTSPSASRLKKNVSYCSLGSAMRVQKPKRQAVLKMNSLPSYRMS